MLRVELNNRPAENDSSLCDHSLIADAHIDEDAFSHWHSSPFNYRAKNRFLSAFALVLPLPTAAARDFQLTLQVASCFILQPKCCISHIAIGLVVLVVVPLLAILRFQHCLEW